MGRIKVSDVYSHLQRYCVTTILSKPLLNLSYIQELILEVEFFNNEKFAVISDIVSLQHWII